MTKSRPNDNGRYFEFLLTDFLVNEFKISLTERAKIDQERDKEKVVDSKVLKKMNDSVIKIKNWLEKQVELNSECILDRLPDKDVNQSTHADISIIGSKKISFSLKHNHDGIFHGRIGACSNWPGIDKQSSLTTKFEKNKKNLYKDIQKKIPIGTKFADNRLVTNGGRVLCVTALGDSLEDAKTSAYELVSKISWENVQYRTDIGWRAIEKNKKN